jgi:hypothetical protein
MEKGRKQSTAGFLSKENKRSTIKLSNFFNKNHRIFERLPGWTCREA